MRRAEQHAEIGAGQAVEQARVASDRASVPEPAEDKKP
jgi:hypothetical protein